MTASQTRETGATTADLVARAAGGESAAWEEIVERYCAVPWSVARQLRLSNEDAADVVQTVWLRLAENLGRLREPERLPGWLATTARREALRVLKHREQPAESVVFEIDNGQPGPEEIVLDDAKYEQLRRAFDRLPQRDQLLLSLLMTDRRPAYHSIAARLGMPLGSIGPTRARALTRLRTELTKTQAEPMKAGRSGTSSMRPLICDFDTSIRPAASTDMAAHSIPTGRAAKSA